MQPVIGKCGSCGIHPGSTVHPASGVCGGGREEQTTNRGFGSPETWHRTEYGLLVELRCTAIQCPTTQVHVASFHFARPEYAARDDPIAEPWRQVLEAPLHPVREPLQLVVVPDPTKSVASGIVNDVLRHVGVRP